MCLNRDFGQNYDFSEGLLFCPGQNQKAKVLKVVSNSWKAVVLSSKAGAHRSLIRNRNADHNVRGICGTYEFALYCITC